MRAAIYQAKDVPLVISTVDDPTPKADQVILKVAGAGICGSDLHMKQYGRAAPGTVFGHEFAGEIAAIGSDVDGAWKVGDRVTALPIMPCRQCEACDTHNPVLCKSVNFVGTSLDRPGAYSEFVAVRGNLVQRLPKGVSFAEGAMVEPLAVGHHAVEQGDVRSGQSILIVGGGPIGAAVALFARMKGARHVVLSERAPERRQLALELGATAVIDAMSNNVAEDFHAIAGKAPDVVFECVGVPGLIQQAIDLVKMRGTVVVAGVTFGDDPIVPLSALLKEVTIKFSQAYNEGDFAAVIDAIAQGRVQVKPMHTRSVSFADLPDAFEELSASPKNCKVLLDPTL